MGQLKQLIKTHGKIIEVERENELLREAILLNLPREKPFELCRLNAYLDSFEQS